MGLNHISFSINPQIPHSSGTQKASLRIVQPLFTSSPIICQNQEDGNSASQFAFFENAESIFSMHDKEFFERLMKKPEKSVPLEIWLKPKKGGLAVFAADKTAPNYRTFARALNAAPLRFLQVSLFSFIFGRIPVFRNGFPDSSGRFANFKEA